MAATETSRLPHVLSQEAATTAILALLVDARDAWTKDDKDVKKIEILLADAGLSIGDITALTGKKTDAVRKVIQRGRKK